MKLTALSCPVLFLTLLSILTAADRNPGKEVFERRCSGCHALDQNKEGPRLRGVYGRRSGSVTGFEYSEALKAAHLIWDADTLGRWLSDPEKLAPNTDMAFRLAMEKERAEIIEYLKSVNASEGEPGKR